MSAPTLGENLIRWAETESSVLLLVQIGSRTRTSGALGAADTYSDWDFQIATTRPEMFSTSAWTKGFAGAALAYVVRSGRLGSAQKVTALFPGGELDLVLIPATGLRSIAQLITLGQVAANPTAMSALTDLSAVLQGGYRILKSSGEFSGIYEHVVREISPPRLSDDTVRQLAEGYVCDYVSTQNKIARGEFLAAQRWLHHHLGEVNLRLLHELRQREGVVSFPDARRIETLSEPRVDAVTIAALPDGVELNRAVEKSAATCRDLVFALLGDLWQWPDLTPLRLRAE